MRFGGGGGGNEKERTRRIKAIGDRIIYLFFGVRAALSAAHAVPIEGSGDALLQRGVGQLITRELFHCELVEALVGVEGFYYIIPVLPHRARNVGMVTIRIGIARQVEPPLCET